MFERFTERARHVVIKAQEEARNLKHNYIDTEHILMGLLQEGEGLGARVLTETFNMEISGVRKEIVKIVGIGDVMTTGQLPFALTGKKSLELALREALSLGHNYIGTEHILLGLVRYGDGVGNRIMLQYNADPTSVREEVIRMLSGPGRRQESPVEREGGPRVAAAKDAAGITIEIDKPVHQVVYDLCRDGHMEEVFMGLHRYMTLKHQDQ